MLDVLNYEERVQFLVLVLQQKKNNFKVNTMSHITKVVPTLIINGVKVPLRYVTKQIKTVDAR